VTLIPAVEIGVWNAWIFILPFLLITYGISFAFVSKKSALWSWPKYSPQQRLLLVFFMVVSLASWIYSIFLPLELGTVWFYAGLPVFLIGMLFATLATLTFARTSADRPNTTGVYRISRNPMYLGILLAYIGIGLVAASWLYLLLAVLYMISQIILLVPPEESFCLDKFGDEYREYMRRTPRLIGIPKS
jgi:protein-S-isoprenylcysteine O-methyltransferase Ste14